VNPFLYPPPALIAFWPLTLVSLLDGQTIFLIISHLCFLVSIWLIITKLTPLPVSQQERTIVVMILLVYSVCFEAVLRTLALGQVNLIVLFFVCLALMAIRKNSSAWRIALPLSVAILLKTYPVFLLAPLLFRKRYKAVSLTLIFLALFSAIAIIALPSRAWTDWLSQVASDGGYANNAISTAFAWNQSINAWVTRLMVTTEFSSAPLPHPALAKTIASGLSLIVIGVTLFASHLFKYRSERGDDEIAAYLLMIFLVAPLSWDHHLVYVLPAAVLATRHVLAGDTGRKTAAAVIVALFFMAWDIPLDRPDWKNGWWTLLISIKLYSVGALWLFFMSRLRNAGGDTSAQPVHV
jgi:alpha-1,2-mannosyltransferase